MSKTQGKAKKKGKKDDIEAYSGAVYYQRTKVFQEEFKLIGVVTEREEIVQQLQTILRDVKEGRKDCDDDTILQTFQLFNKVRFSTIKAIKAISIWQDSFTRNIRPIIFQNDYIQEKLIKQINFINATKLKKIFNFQFFRGNLLLLPFPNLNKNDTPIKVSPALGKEIREFAYPLEQDIIASYNILYNCLPEEYFHEKLISLEKWLLEPWVPRIWIANGPIEQKYFHPSGKPKTIGDYMNEEKKKKQAEKQGSSRNIIRSRPTSPQLTIAIPKTPNSASGSRPSSPTALQLLSATSKGSSPASKASATPISRKQSSFGVTPTTRKQSSFGRGIPVTTPVNKVENEEVNPVVKLKRRNQLAPTQTAQLLSFTNLDRIDDVLLEQKKATEMRSDEELQRVKELQEIEDYYLNLEKTFLVRPSSFPKLPPIGTAATTPLKTPVNPLQEQLSPDPMKKTGRVFFLHLRNDGSTVGEIEEDDDLLSQGKLSLTNGKDETKSLADSTSDTKATEVKSKEKRSKKEEKKLDKSRDDDEEDNSTVNDEESLEEKADSKQPDLSRSENDRDVVKEIGGPKRLTRLTKQDSRRISDLTVTFSVHSDQGGKKDSRRRSSSLKSEAIRRKQSSATSSTDRTASSNSTSSTNLKKNLSKIRLSTSFVREWYKVQGK